jgi:hypothetical protein
MSNGLPSTGFNSLPADSKRNWTEEIDKVAKKIVDLGMEMPAVLFLEAHKPVTFFINQFFIFLAPIVAPLFGGRTEEVAKFFEDRDNIEKLIKRIEEKSEEKRLEARLLKNRFKNKG